MAEQFTLHTCWRADEAAQTINTEAVSPSRAVFLATHAPLRLRRSQLTGGTRNDAKNLERTEDLVDENAVLSDFLDRQSDTGALLMPVVGGSGTGKSHLIRWVREQLEDTRERKIIYLEKGKTSLKAVIAELLADLESDKAADLRRAIGQLSSSVEPDALARRLINSIEEELSATTQDGISGPTRVLRGPRGVAVLLQDPHVRSYMLEPTRFIPQLAHQLLHDRRDGEQQRPERFTREDLPLEFAEIKQVARMTASVLNMLGTNPVMKDAAVDLLNQCLEDAVKRAFRMGSGSLVSAMEEVRKEYARQGREIIVLVEDFALIQGMQRELLDAMIEPARRDGVDVLARIRTLLAVTTGYFQSLPETVLTRLHATVGYVYDLDAPFDAAGQGEDYMASFVARYLNAARLGADALRTVSQAGEVPNHCEECPFRVECHAAFGVSEEGYGLYPFNRSALTRAVHSTAPAEAPYQFVPRAVLGSVVHKVLVEDAKPIGDGAFPHQGFRDRFRRAKIDAPLDSALLDMVESTYPTEVDRYRTFLEFWGNAESPFDGEMAVRLAFGLAAPKTPSNPQPRTSDTPKSSTEHAKATPKGQSPLPPGLRDSLREIEEWATTEGKAMPNAARHLRAVAADVVLQRYTWADPLMNSRTKESLKSVWSGTSGAVHIRGARGGLKIAPESAPIQFAKSGGNAQFFKSVLLLKEGHPPNSMEAVYRLAELAESKAADLTTAIRVKQQISDSDLVLGLRASLIGAALAGRARPGMSEAETVDMVLHDGEGWKREDSATRVPRWNSTLEDHLSKRHELVTQIRDAVGISQGERGKVRMIDAAHLLPLLNEAAREWTWQVGDRSVPAWVSPAVKGFLLLPRLVEDQVEALRDLLAALRRRVARGTKVVVPAVIDAMDEARQHGLPLSWVQSERLTTLGAAVKDADWHAITELEDDLARLAGAPAEDQNMMTRVKLTVAARGRDAALPAIRDFLEASDTWLDEVLESAKNRSGGYEAETSDNLRSVVREWADIVRSEEPTDE
ncbi:protein DpdH [Nocardia wallacei]|uniref:protein DpdH n=1 Tax=Nocardia wallacei TaxID=480035 RepID=UPI00245402E5|nr:protein DpdH [Nocardia wallacei]